MRKLWLGFTLVMVVSFLVLGWVGTRIYQEMPPIPDKVVTTDGTLLIDRGEITAGQNVWQIDGRNGSRLRVRARQLYGS
jgi:nitric oxide reductase subunit B